MSRQIVNPIFFIRGFEPRDNSIDLPGTLVKQIELVNKYGFPATFLVQYDAFINEGFAISLKTQTNGSAEIGGWLEIVQPLAEKAGIKWRGRYSWDWHSDVGFSVGYTPREREKLIDVFMSDFKSVFGAFPKSVGSWVIDAHSLAYLYDKYAIEASCNCRDQWGTDGYTLWGGYYGQGYYPSRRNMLCPAQTAEKAIPVPVFRMLGSDPIYQYDTGLIGNERLESSEDQGVVTLEPVYSGNSSGGGDRKWVDWFFSEYFSDNLGFGYVQAGQENSFGWDLMKDGLEYQFEALDRLVRSEKLTVETLLDTGRWYSKTFPLTATTTIVALSDWNRNIRNSIWYNCLNYRANIYSENDVLWIRDIQKFDEDYKERYLTDSCKEPKMIYDNLPVIDGNRWSRGTVRAGLRFAVFCDGSSRPLGKGKLDLKYPDSETMEISFESGQYTLGLIFTPRAIRVLLSGGKSGEALVISMTDGLGKMISLNISGNELRYTHNSFEYAVGLKHVRDISVRESGITLKAQNREIELELDCK